MSKHAKGPWKKWDRRDVDQGVLITNESGEVGICRVIGESQDPEATDRKKAKAICMANADLIVSAPELLDACKRFLICVGENGGNTPSISDFTSMVSMVKSAVAKAEGI